MSRHLSGRVARLERRLAIRRHAEGEARFREALKRMTEEELDAFVLCFDQGTGAWTGGLGTITAAEAEIACKGLLKLDCGHVDTASVGLSHLAYLTSVTSMTDPRRDARTGGPSDANC